MASSKKTSPSNGSSKGFISSVANKATASLLATMGNVKSNVFDGKVPNDADSTSDTSFGIATESIKMHSFTIRPENVFGWLYKNWETLQKWKLLFYVFDFTNLLMYECEQSAAESAPRSIISLKNARLGDKYEKEGQLYCWNLYIRSEQEGKPPKIFKLGAQTEKLAKQWMKCLKSGIVNRSLKQVIQEIDPNNAVQSMESRQPATVLRAPNLDGKAHDAAIHPTVIIGGRRYNLRCGPSTTNAWLMSEAIRVYMRENANRDPHIIRLYNATQEKNMDLGNDLNRSYNHGDIIEAVMDPMYKRRQSEQASQGETSSYGSKPQSGTIQSGTQKWVRKYRTTSGATEQELMGNGEELDEGDTDIGRMVESPWNSLTIRKDVSKEFCKILPSNTHDIVNQILNSSNLFMPYWLSDEWNKSSLENGLRLYKSDVNDAIACVTMVGASPSQVLDCIIGIDKQSQWDPTFDHGSILELGQHHDVVHVVQKPMRVSPFGSILSGVNIPVFPRDFCISRRWKRFEDGSFLCIYTPDNHPYCKNPPALHVRGKMSGGFIIKPVEIPTGAEYSVVIHICDVEFGGIAVKNLKEHAKVQCVSVLAGIREYISCTVNEIS